MSGKLSKRSDYYFATCKKTGAVYTGKVNTVNNVEPTESQLEARRLFASRINAVNDWIEKNQPSESQPKGSEEYKKMLAAYKVQYKIGNWRAFLFKKLGASANGNGGNAGSGSGDLG